MRRNKDVFYGWWIVLVIFTMWFALPASPFVVILKLLMNQFQIGRGPISIIPSIYFISGGISSFFVGRLLEHRDPRKFMLWGAVSGGICFLLGSLANSLWYLYAIYFFLGVGLNGFAGAIPVITLLSKWFNRRRGQVIGLGFAGASLGSLAITPLVALIAQNFGWRATYIFAGSLLLAIHIPLVLFVIRNSPEEMGLLPDGVKAAIKTTIDSNDPPADSIRPGTRLFPLLKSRPLWLICLGFAFIALGNQAIMQHALSFYTDMGISATLAATAFGLTVALGGVGGLISGWLADRLRPRYVSMIFLTLATGGVFILMRTNTVLMVWLFVVVYGISYGVAGVLLPLVIRDIFGAANFSSIFGLVNIVFMGGFALGVPLAGFIFDATGSYSRVFIIVAILYLTALVAIYFVGGAKLGRVNNLPKR